MKTTEIIALIGIAVTLIVTIINQITSRINIKHTKYLETVIVGRYNNLTTVKRLIGKVLISTRDSDLILNETKYDELLFNIFYLKMEIGFLYNNETLLKLLTELEMNIKNKYAINYEDIIESIYEEAIQVIGINSLRLSEILSHKLTKIKGENEWGFN